MNKKAEQLQRETFLVEVAESYVNDFDLNYQEVCQSCHVVTVSTGEKYCNGCCDEICYYLALAYRYEEDILVHKALY
jgi:hypothetical protein